MDNNNKDLVTIEPEYREIKKELSVSSDDVSRVADHLKQIKMFVKDIMKRGADYDAVPGTKKDFLHKPGAEKLMRLFGLGVRFKQVEKEFCRIENFALYAYEAEVYHLKTNTIIASCEGTCNSQEKKYATRRNRKGEIEATPVCDILNTVKKMAQKRAMVGAVIIATSASDYFTQDEEEVEAQAPRSTEPKKATGDKFVNNEQEDLSGYLIKFGKYKNKTFNEMPADGLENYIDYLKKQNPEAGGAMQELIDKGREFLRNIEYAQ